MSAFSLGILSEFSLFSITFRLRSSKKRILFSTSAQPVFFRGDYLCFCTQVRQLLKQRVMELSGFSKGARRGFQPAGWSIEQSPKKIDVLPRTPPIAQAIHSRPSLAPRGFGACGISSVAAVGGQKRRSEGGGLTQRQRITSMRTLLF